MCSGAPLRTSSRLTARLSWLALVPCVAVAVGSTLAGCGGTSTPFVDPRPLSDGGIPDRVLLEAGGSDGSDATPDGGDAGLLADGATPDVTADGGYDAADGRDDSDGAADGRSSDGASSDAAPLPTTVILTMIDPVEDALQTAARRFAPTVQVLLTTDRTRTDDVKLVDVELWSTGATAAKISTTHLAQLSKTTPGAADGGAPAPDGDDAGSSGDGAADSSDPDAAVGGSGGAGGAGGAAAPSADDETVQTLFTFGDTPIDLSSVTTGSYELRVTTATLAGLTASLARKIRIDAGPIIRVISPTPDQAVRGSIFVSIQVIDPFSTVPPTVSITVANLPVTPLAMVGDLYQATVAKTLATPPLSGAQLLDVGAVNTAGVAARHVTVRFIFDEVGPVITNGKPATGSLIGGIVKLEAEITDPAGVDVNTVVAVVAHGDSALEVRLDQDPNDPKHFSHLFDTRRLSNTVLYPTVSFRASDLPGNQSNIGYTVAVDNTPPLSDLDPPADLRVRRLANQIWRCSWPFDPVGTDAVSDGDYVLQLFDVRARVQDEGNTPVAGGADITPLSGLDPANVRLLVLDDTSRALVVDSDGDGICDSVNPKLVPTTTPMSSQDALLVNLAPVTPAGAADLTWDPSIPMNGYPDCIAGNDPQRPILLCRTTSLSIAISSHYTATEAGVWTIPKAVAGTLQCVGNQFDSLGNHIKDGPACLAVQAVDRLVNSQVSRVLHVCIDHDGDGAECPFAPLAGVQGGNPVQITTVSPHGLATGDRALVGAVPTLFDANGLWKVTVLSSTTFTLDDSNTAQTAVAGGQFMRWTSPSDCTGRQTGLNPVVVDDATSCRPWRRFNRGEHLEVE